MLDGVTVRDSTAGDGSFFGGDGGSGGGIYNSGTLTLIDGVLSNNRAGDGSTPFGCFSGCSGGDGGDGGSGGNLFDDGGVVAISGSVVSIE